MPGDVHLLCLLGAMSRWRILSPDGEALWSPRRSHTVLSLDALDDDDDDALVLLGGFGSPRPPHGIGSVGDVWRSTDGGREWHQLTAQAPWGPRDGHAVRPTSNHKIEDCEAHSRRVLTRPTAGRICPGSERHQTTPASRVSRAPSPPPPPRRVRSVVGWGPRAAAGAPIEERLKPPGRCRRCGLACSARGASAPPHPLRDG